MPRFTAAETEPHLRNCGYTLLRRNFAINPTLTIPLVAFAHHPLDARSACIAIIETDAPGPAIVASVWELGTPIVLLFGPNGMEWWKQSTPLPERIGSPIPPSAVGDFFKSHEKDFGPAAVYRAKTWARFDRQHQLWFVDHGLMPLVESEIGSRMTELIVRCVDKLKRLMSWKVLNNDRSEWLLKAVFWLLSAKILADKGVASFSSLDFLDPAATLASVASHFGTPGVPIPGEREHLALREIATDISRFASLELATTESLAYVYENTLVSTATRKALGTHSTPTFLVDYIVGRLKSDIESLGIDNRNVFEPACGHCAFLVSAMRLLTEVLPDELRVPEKRRSYLRDRMHGLEVDAFSLEIARLSLCMTDIPNPNYWDLKPCDVFQTNDLETYSQKATILLTNPPFENFSDEERAWYAARGTTLRHRNKTVEILMRVLPELPLGTLVGVVTPQGLLHSDDATSVRKLMAEDFAIHEICTFSDDAFTKADSESAVIIGRKVGRSKKTLVSFNRVREADAADFRTTYQPSFHERISQSAFVPPLFDMRVVEFCDLWKHCEGYDQLDTVALVQKGFEFLGKDLPPGAVTYGDQWFSGAERGYVHFDSKQSLHNPPPSVWINTDPAVIRRKGAGISHKSPQLLMNYAPVRRGPWKLKAFIDNEGISFSSRFVCVRPKTPSVTLEFLWAIINSPLANARAYAHSLKRDVLVSLTKSTPLPPTWQLFQGQVVSLVQKYLESAVVRPTQAREDLVRLEGFVLSLYRLPVDIEGRLLGMFRGSLRPGVPFHFDQYLPREVEGHLSLSTYVDITTDWEDINKERTRLIQKKVSREITSEEKVRLAHLQETASVRQRIFAPLPLIELGRMSQQLLSTESGPDNGV